jgi:L-threonylcarbamoyladenylate synthase
LINYDIALYKNVKQEILIQAIHHYLQKKKALMKPLFWDNSATLSLMQNELKKGEVLLAAGDTVLGLLADISMEGYLKLDDLKKRSQKPYLLLVENPKKALNFIEKSVENEIQIEKLMSNCWPGPLTLILRAKDCVPLGVKSSEGNVALRMPAHEGLLALLHHFDALYSTSANTSGKPVPGDLDQVETTILDGVACVVLNEDQTAQMVPSTIIDCTGETVKIVREGAFAIDRLQEYLLAEKK